MKLHKFKMDLLLHPAEHFPDLRIQKLFGISDTDHSMIVVIQVCSRCIKMQRPGVDDAGIIA